VCNVQTSAMVRECKLAYITRAGAEIGVASTKAFTTQLAGLFLLTLVLAGVKGRMTESQEAAHLKAMRHLPAALSAVLALEPQIISWAEDFAAKENALFLGRGLHYPIALEGALKLKEITYIHAEAYAAGELKHGPLALVTSQMPVVTVAPNDTLLEKLKSNMQEVRARGGVLYVLADADTRIESEEGIHVIRMPEHYGPLSPLLHVVPLQLLAYHTAVARGTDVDKPQEPGEERDRRIAFSARSRRSQRGRRDRWRHAASRQLGDASRHRGGRERRPCRCGLAWKPIPVSGPGLPSGRTRCGRRTAASMPATPCPGAAWGRCRAGSGPCAVPQASRQAESRSVLFIVFPSGPARGPRRGTGSGAGRATQCVHLLRDCEDRCRTLRRRGRDGNSAPNVIVACCATVGPQPSTAFRASSIAPGISRAR
jgi:hypothetical protein